MLFAVNVSVPSLEDQRVLTKVGIEVGAQERPSPPERAAENHQVSVASWLRLSLRR